MKRTKALILDLFANSPGCKELRGILKSSPNLANNLRVESLKPDDSPQFDSKFSGTISQINPDIVFFVISSNHLKSTTELVQDLRRQKTSPSVVAIIENGKPDEMVTLLEAGVDDFITPPLKRTNVIPRVWRLLEHKTAKNDLTFRLKEKLGLKQLLGESQPFLDEVKKIPTVAGCDATVLISGETGTGKELCARAIHYLSPRASKPFIPINCGAIPTELMENELFGHVQGAFTGASTARQGLISMADSGTMFLDDIDCLPSISQAKLLRFLQEKEYRQLGAAKIFHADVRVIAATNSDMEAAVDEGKLRRDLYYRLNVIPLMLPALRDRKEDIPLLARHFLKRYAIDFKKQIAGFASGAIVMFMHYDWPGNVRELEHVVERAVLFSEHKLIRETDIFLPHKKSSTFKMSFKEAKANMVNNFERSYIERLLISYKGNITKSAQAAQKNRRAFWQLIRKHGIDVQNFKPG
jgi:DNA-binding NtrC family response regulator